MSFFLPGPAEESGANGTDWVPPPPPSPSPRRSVPKFHNQSLRFLLLPSAAQPASLFPIIDTVSAADFTIVALSSEQEVDEQGETVLRCLTGLGVGGANGGVLGVVKVREVRRLSSHTGC